MTAWIPTTDLLTLRRLGKLQEEIGELGVVLARAMDLGLEALDAEADVPLRLLLEQEIADVYAQIDETLDWLRATFTLPMRCSGHAHAGEGTWSANLQEVLSRLTIAAARCMLQGMDGIEPATGEANRSRLLRALSAVHCKIDELVSSLALRTVLIEQRRATKRGLMQGWEAQFKPTTTGEIAAPPAAQRGIGRRGVLFTDGFAGRRECECRIIGETKCKYRIEVDQTTRLPRRTLAPGDRAWVPRWSVRVLPPLDDAGPAGVEGGVG